MQQQKWTKAFWLKFLREAWKVNTPREHCFVCGKYQSITHAHHVIPVAEVATLFTKADVQPEEAMDFRMAYIWLCPNHHTIFHLIHNRSMRNILTLAEDIGEDEVNSMKRVFDLVDYSEVTRITTKAIERKRNLAFNSAGV